MSFNEDDLRALREKFRERMNEVDFCIGEEQVEKLFRELLNEPEPKSESYTPIHSNINTRQVLESELDRFTKMTKDIFESDDILYRKLK